MLECGLDRVWCYASHDAVCRGRNAASGGRKLGKVTNMLAAKLAARQCKYMQRTGLLALSLAACAAHGRTKLHASMWPPVQPCNAYVVMC